MKHVLQRAKRHPPSIVLTLDLEERSVVESAASPWEQVRYCLCHRHLCCLHLMHLLAVPLSCHDRNRIASAGVVATGTKVSPAL